MNSFYDERELNNIGFKSIGKNVLVSRKASIYSPELIELGDNVRIDDFCVLSGKIKVGSYVHIAASCFLFGGEKGIEINDFCGLSSRVSIYALSDDYSGECLTNPTVPLEYRKLIDGKVILEKHVIIGTGTTILPGVKIGEGTAIGAMSMVLKDIEPWVIAIGNPVRVLKSRSKALLEMEKELRNKNFN
ncbi:MAG: acyltransferase [Brevinematia bacterium]